MFCRCFGLWVALADGAPAEPNGAPAGTNGALAEPNGAPAGPNGAPVGPAKKGKWINSEDKPANRVHGPGSRVYLSKTTSTTNGFECR